MLLDGFLSLEANSATGRTNTVHGESRDFDTAWQGQIAITSFEFGAESSECEDELNPKVDGKDVSSNYAPISFKIDKVLDLASPALFKAYALMFNKQVDPHKPPFASATVGFRKCGGDTPVEYTSFYFRDVVLVAWNMDCKDDGTTSESATFRFQSCSITYTTQADSGEMEVVREYKGWDFSINGPS